MILINASNLHVGGGVQVAASFIDEVFSQARISSDIYICASQSVKQNSLCSESIHSGSESFREVDVKGFDIFDRSFYSYLDHFDSVFTVFGPLYSFKRKFKSIVGFAQPWIIYPDNECYAMLPFFQRHKTRLKFWLQSYFFKRADVLVVELEHVKKELIRVLDIPADRIHVVHNCLSSVYLNNSIWQPVGFSVEEGFLRLGFLGRNYLHKNTAIFPGIVNALERLHGIKARFYVTFNEQEWACCSPEFRSVCINVGSLTVAQCPHFYQELDAVVFPSLLECFSATPLEAMAMKRPLFASDRPFNRDVCGSHAYYFDPLSPVSAADAIAKVFGGAGPKLSDLAAAREYAINFSSPKERAEKYLTLLNGEGFSGRVSRVGFDKTKGI